MAPAAAAVAAAKTINRHGQVRDKCDQLALVTPYDCPGAQHVAGFGQIVDVPAYRLAATHVARNPCTEAARPFCRTAIEIAARSERYCRLFGQGQYEWPRQFDREHVGAGSLRNRFVTGREFHHVRLDAAQRAPDTPAPVSTHLAVQRKGIIDPCLRGASKPRLCAAQSDIELMPKEQILASSRRGDLKWSPKKQCKRLTDSSHYQKDATILPHKANSRPGGPFRKGQGDAARFVESAARASMALKLK